MVLKVKDIGKVVSMIYVRQYVHFFSWSWRLLTLLFIIMCVCVCSVRRHDASTLSNSLTRVYTACAIKGTIERQKTTLLIMKASKESNSLAKFHAQIFFSILRNIPIPTVSNSQRDVTFVMITILAKQWNYFNCLLYLCSNTH